MAKNETNSAFELKDYKAVSYNGQFAFTDGDYAINGSLGASSEKVLTSLSGTIKKADNDEGSFNGYLVGDKLKYNFSNVPTEDIATIAALVQNAEAEAKKAIQAVN